MEENQLDWKWGTIHEWDDEFEDDVDEEVEDDGCELDFDSAPHARAVTRSFPTRRSMF